MMGSAAMKSMSATTHQVPALPGLTFSNTDRTTTFSRVAAVSYACPLTFNALMMGSAAMKSMSATQSGRMSSPYLVHFRLAVLLQEAPSQQGRKHEQRPYGPSNRPLGSTQELSLCVARPLRRRVVTCGGGAPPFACTASP